MDRSQLIRFQTFFEQQAKSGVPVLRQLNENDVDKPSDSLDQAAFLQEQLLADALQSRRSISIQGAKAALDRIRKGLFGICEECGEDIDSRRLEIHPTTSFCIHCQEEYEHRIGA